MADQPAAAPLVRIKRELEIAEQALNDPGAGARGTIECRIADLQGRLLSTPAGTPAEVAARLEIAAALVRSLGPRGYLLDLIEACIVDLRALAAAPPAGDRDPG